MKICHIITRLVVGGAQENTIFTVEGLKKKGYSVDLISGKTEGPEGTLEDRVKEKNINLIVIPQLIRDINPVLDFIAFLKIFKVFKKSKYDIIHTHSAKAGFLGRIAGRLANKKTIIIHTIHGPSFFPHQKKFSYLLYKTAEKIAEKFTDHFICVGEIMKERYLKNGIGREEQYSVVYSGFHIQPYIEAEKEREKMRESIGIKKEEKVIGMIGRLFPLKGQKYLLYAFSEIVKEFPDTKLIFVGDGILKEKLMEMAKEYGIEEKVIFAGLIPPEKIPEYISAMDIVAHTSLREGLPKAVAQGMAGGKPVVAFDVDGTKEVVINGETGFLIKPKDVETLIEKIKFLLKNPVIAENMGRKGREKIKKMFPVEKMVDEIEKIYLNLKK